MRWWNWPDFDQISTSISGSDEIRSHFDRISTPKSGRKVVDPCCVLVNSISASTYVRDLYFASDTSKFCSTISYFFDQNSTKFRPDFEVEIWLKRTRFILHFGHPNVDFDLFSKLLLFCEWPNFNHKSTSKLGWIISDFFVLKSDHISNFVTHEKHH